MYAGLMPLIGSSDTPDVEICRSWAPQPFIETFIPSLARRAFLQTLGTRRSPPILIPGPINRMPPEILSKVFVLAALSDLTPMSDGSTTSSTYFPMVLCHVSSDWRQIAFSTPQIWEHLSTYVDLFGTPHETSPGTLGLEGLLVKQRSIEFLTWWAANIRDNNAFALRIELIWHKSAEFYRGRYGGEIITLDETGLSTLLGLVCRARYLHLQNYSGSFSYLTRHPDSAALVPEIFFPSMESLVFQGHSFSNCDDDFQKLPFHLMPALRKLRLGNIELFDPHGSGISCPAIRTNLNNMWGRLTHLDLRIRTTLVGWKNFIGICTALENARIGVMLTTSPDDGDNSSSPRGGMLTLPQLHELCLDVFDPYEHHTEANIFQDLHFPRLKTLVLHTNILSTRLLHLLMQATPSLERLHISTRFPVLLIHRGQVIWESSGDTSEGRLKEHAPHLKQLLINIPPADEYKSPLTEYARSIVRSGWLQGPWKNGPLCLELLWLSRWDDRHLEIQQLKRFLDSQTEAHGDVDISVKEIKTSPFSLKVDLVVPLWDAWFNIDANFCRSEGESSYLMPPQAKPTVLHNFRVRSHKFFPLAGI